MQDFNILEKDKTKTVE